jgi:uncharacterized protein DUF6515
MSKRFTILAVTGALVAAIVAPAHAWVAARGSHGAVAVGGNRCCYHSNCCYSGGAVAGAAVAGLAVGAVAGAAAASAARPPAVVVAAPPVVYAVPAPVVVGTVVYALPAGCTAAVVNGVQYFNCGGGFYQPVYQGGGVAYQIVPAP